MKKWIDVAKAYIKKRYMLLLLTVWLVFFMEAISRNLNWSTLWWGFMNVPAYLLNVMIIFGALLVITSLTGKIKLSYWLVSAACFSLALISGVKLKMLGIPLLPWDFVLTGEATDMAEYLKNIFTFEVIASLLIFIGISWYLLRKTSRTIIAVRWKERLAFMGIAVVCVAIVFLDKPIPVKAALGVSAITWDQSEHVEKNGLLLATVLNLDYMGVNKVEEYNSQKIADIIAGVPKASYSEQSANPNVIVVLSESLWDPTQLKTAKFNEDPMPFLHELQQKTATGTLLSTAYGGGTSNVEFEVLTGNSMRFFPHGTFPYNQHINHGIDTLASILSRQGYYATAISPYHRWYFNSDKVYKNFGFAQYISMEFFDPVYEGQYIADSEVSKLIMEQTEKTTKRDFIFANTMQNHFPYTPEKFKENPFQVEGDLPPDSKGMLETYAKGAKAADNMLKTLVEHFEKSEEPTILVFFGDHMPHLGDDYKVYKDTNWISGNGDPDFLNKMYRTPVVVWSNYLPEQKETINMSPSFLGPYVLEKAKLSGNYYTDFLLELYKKHPLIPPEYYYEEMKINKAEIRKYETLQYDIMFGERFAYGDQKNRIVNPDYVLGYGPMEIEQVTPGTFNAGKAVEIEVKGKNIPPLGVLFANGKELKTKQGPGGALVAILPADVWKSGIVDLQVKVVDSKNIIIGESKLYTLQSEPN